VSDAALPGDGSPDDAGPPEGPEHRDRGAGRAHPRWLLPLIGASIVALVIASNVGNAVWASWIIDRPYGLLALNSSNKYLIGTFPNTELWAVLVVGTARLMAPDPLFYAIGYLYRDRALHWARTAFPGAGGLFDLFEDDEDESNPLILDVLVFVMPNNPVCLLAGVAAMDRVRFIVLALSGTIGRIVLMRVIGWLFSDEIESILDVVARYQRWLTILSVALVALYVAWQVRGRRGLIGGVEELEEELGD